MQRPPLFDMMPELQEYAVLTTELVAEREFGSETAARVRSLVDPLGTVLGHVAWPHEEPWPWRVPDGETDQEWLNWCPEATDEKPEPQPFSPVLQLRREDAPSLSFPPGKDLLQVLWHFYEHDYIPKVLVRWRTRSELGQTLVDRPLVKRDRYNEGRHPPPASLKSNGVWVLPDIRTTSLGLLQAVARVDQQISEHRSAFFERERLREARHIGPGLTAKLQDLMMRLPRLGDKPDAFMATANSLIADVKDLGPLPPAEEPSPPEGYLELGLAKGIRVGVDGFCPQVLTNALPHMSWRHILTVGDDAWPDGHWAVPRGGGNIHIFVGADWQTAHVLVDCWAGVVSSVEDYLEPGWGDIFEGGDRAD